MIFPTPIAKGMSAGPKTSIPLSNLINSTQQLSKPNFSSLLDAVDMMETSQLVERGRHQQNSRPAYRWKDSRKAVLLSQETYLQRGQEKANRKRLCPDSVKILSDIFESGIHFPTRDHREKLSKRLGLPVRTIQIWFQNRRQAYKNKQQSSISNGRRESEAGETINSVLMTKLKYDKRVDQLVEAKSSIRTPSYLNPSSGCSPLSFEPCTPPSHPPQRRRHSDGDRVKTESSLPASRSMSLESKPLLPKPPITSQFAPMMRSLPTKLPEIRSAKSIDEEMTLASSRLPSICRALRRFSVY